MGVSLSHNAHWGAHDYHVIGLEDDLLSTAGELRNKDGVIVERPPYHTAVQGQDAEFVAAVREGRAPALDVDAVLPTLRILQAAWESPDRESSPGPRHARGSRTISSQEWLLLGFLSPRESSVSPHSSPGYIA